MNISQLPTVIKRVARSHEENYEMKIKKIYRNNKISDIDNVDKIFFPQNI